MSDLLKDRKFLHDFATPLMIMKVTIKKLRSELDPDTNGIPDLAKCLERLEMASKAVENMEHLHAEFLKHIAQKTE